MAEVFGLHGAAHLQREIVVHLQQHVRHVYVLAAVAKLVADDTEHEGNKLAHVVGTPLCEIRVDHNGGEGDSAQGQRPRLIVHQLLLAQIILEVVIKAMIRTMPVDVLLQVLVPQEIIRWIVLCVASRVMLAKDIGADTSEEKAVSLLTHFDLY